MIKLLTHPFSPKYYYSQTFRSRDLTIWHNVYHPLCVTWHMSCVTCHMSGVTCHVSPVTCPLSPVTCHMSPVTCKNFVKIFLLKKKIFMYISLKKIGKSGGASRWRVCYQRGLSCLVLIKKGLTVAIIFSYYYLLIFCFFLQASLPFFDQKLQTVSQLWIYSFCKESICNQSIWPYQFIFCYTSSVFSRAPHLYFLWQQVFIGSSSTNFLIFSWRKIG